MRAINLAGAAAQKGFGRPISVENVRVAARDWYQRDKASIIRANPGLHDLLIKIIDEIIGRRRARAFLFPSNQRSEQIDRLFDSRLLHILKRNISSHDRPDERFDVLKLDYGCYVELISTTRAPLGLFPSEDPSMYVGVPADDYRSIRNAVYIPNS